SSYLTTINQLGYSSIQIGEHAYRPAQLEFYNLEERKVKKGSLLYGATLPSPSPLFKELTVSGEVSFYENGQVKSVKVGQRKTSTSNGVPDKYHLYQTWPLVIGGNALLSGTASFDEGGQFLG